MVVVADGKFAHERGWPSIRPHHQVDLVLSSGDRGLHLAVALGGFVDKLEPTAFEVPTGVAKVPIAAV